MLNRVLIIFLVVSLSSCSSWVFKRDIAQGNYLEPRLIEKLQIEMTKEQVKYVLGSPILLGSYDNNTWHYIYRFKSGRDEDFNMEKRFTVKFENDKLVSAEGDFTLPESFYVPMIN